MKKLLLFALSVGFVAAVNAQNCTSLIDQNANTLGVNPDPPVGSVAGIPYDEVNTLVLPRAVDNTLTGPPGDSINLCAIEIKNVIGMPPGYTYEVWGYHGYALNTNPYDILAQTVDTIHIFQQQPVTRICIRLKNNNPPMSTDMGDGMPDRDTAYVQVAVEAYITTFGCNSAGAAARDTFEIGICIHDSLYAGIEDQDVPGFSVKGNYPNPAVDITYLNFVTPTQGEVTISVMDAVGRMVVNSTMQSTVGTNSYPLSTTDLRSGIYIYNITFRGKTISKKMIVNK